jgi:sporulation protein YlmC with PRC-barrel domain
MQTAKSFILAGILPLLMAPALVLAERDREQAGPAGIRHHGGEAFITTQDPDQFMAEDLIGRPAQDREGQRIGEVADLLVDRFGQVAGLIVRVDDEFLQMTGPRMLPDDRREREAARRTEQRYERRLEGEAARGLVGVRWDAVEVRYENDQPVARLDIERDALAQATEFEPRRVAAEVQRERDRDPAVAATRERQPAAARQREQDRPGVAAREREPAAARQREQDRPGVAAREREPAAARQREQDRPGVAAREREPAAAERRERATVGMDAIVREQRRNQHLADDLIGSAVEDARGQEIGRVSNLVVDEQGRIAGLVIEVGGFLGIGAREVALEWNAIQLTTDADGEPLARVDIDRQTLEQAPEFRPLEGVRTR